VRVRVWRLVVVLVIGAFLAAACGGGGDDDDGDAKAGGGDETTTTSGAPAPDEIEVDRSGRFSKIETFCEPAEDDEAEGDETPEAAGDGITSTEINVSHIRMKLEQAAGLGFALDIGDPKDAVATFVKLVNDRCGGIHGRELKVSTSEVDVISSTDSSTLEQAACIQAAEDNDAVFAFSTSGYGGAGVSCLTQRNDVIFITSYTTSLDDIEKADGKLYAVGLAGEEQLTYLARDLAEQGLLEGKTIGVVHSDEVLEAPIVERGLVDVLENELGLEVKRDDTIGCQGGRLCNQGVIPSVQGMIADGVDVLFPTLNVLSLPGYLKEMAAQGVKPGDVKIYQSGFAAQSGDLVSGKVPELGGPAAGKLYDGTTIIAGGSTGDFRLEGFEPDPFAEMCNREYAENGHPEGGKAYSPTDEATSTKYGATTGICSAIRMIARAIDAAGANPTRDDLVAAMQGLGPIDQGAAVPGSFGTGKYTAPNALYTLTFHYPCPHPTTAKSGSCILPDSEGRALPTEPLNG
jgi:hypothetical protein